MLHSVAVQATKRGNPPSKPCNTPILSPNTLSLQMILPMSLWLDKEWHK